MRAIKSQLKTCKQSSKIHVAIRYLNVSVLTWEKMNYILNRFSTIKTELR